MAAKRQTREEVLDGDERKHQHQPAVSNALKVKLDHLRTVEPLTKNQADFFSMYNSGSYFMGLFGSPGVGKTYAAFYKAIEEVLNRDNPFKQVVVVRSTVSVRDIGFLPGSIEEKQEIYELPYKEICANLFNRADAWQRLCEQGHARCISTSFVRGLTIDDAIILVDEAQNMTWVELSSVLGRVGYRSKIIFCGDKFQNDLVRSKNDQSGLEEFLGVVKTMPEFESIYFTPDDIVRSSLVKSFIMACAAQGKLPGH